MLDFECVVDAKAALGEGPLWDPRDQVLWWLDIKGHAIHCFDPATGKDRHVDRRRRTSAALAVRERGGLSSRCAADCISSIRGPAASTPSVDPEADRPENRFNDGKPDRQGRFWPGSMYEGDHPTPSAGLYRLDADLSCRRMVSDIVCSNGLAWSPDSKVMYYADSLAQRVWAWDFDPATGEIDNRRSFIDTAPFGSNPDGATVDADGAYWLTLPEADKVGRFDPAGKLMRMIDLPGASPDLRDVRRRRSRRALHHHRDDVPLRRRNWRGRPLTGGLFAMDRRRQGPAGSALHGLRRSGGAQSWPPYFPADHAAHVVEALAHGRCRGPRRPRR